jgi:putative tryptophan/tyrosine transport system substrate-binding protein
MRRRELIAGATGLIAYPLGASAQQARLPLIGFLHSGSPGPFAHLVAAFREGLRETGYVEGQNVAIDFRWAEGNYDLLPSLALDLVRRDMAVIVAAGSSPALAAKAATRTLPIVFVSGGDPLGRGLVAGIERPGGNATGINVITAELTGKRLALLRELVPSATLIAVLLNTSNPNAAGELGDIQQAARSVGQAIHIAKATSERDIDAAFNSFPDFRPDALLLAPDPFFYSRRNQIVRLATRYTLPALYFQREFALAGGLASYGASLADGYRQAGIYAGRILAGASPAELPVTQSAKFELVFNLRTARALGLVVTPALLAQANEVIE